MPRIIDLECSVPYGAAAEAKAAEASPAQPGYGMANYGRIFRSRREGADHRPEGELDAYMDHLATLGIVRSVPFGLPNAETGELLRRFPGRFLGLARISINEHKGMSGVRELERLVRDEGFSALGVSALVDCIPASDRRYYPLYTKAAELGIPVRIYSSMNYANDRPYDLGHPRHLDQVAIDFPELRIIAGLGGWPWINDMVGLLRRHPNLACDTASHHPRYFGTEGSGWEMLLQFGNTLLQDKVMVGFSAEQFGLSIPEMVKLYEALPLKEAVVEKWLYGNAKRVLRLH